ncbi:MAG: hypothetical protein H7061_09885 [Bdellovibrionaceae bacterium]|nr:hypothetical protein [Bdellovibrio sp.]
MSIKNILVLASTLFVLGCGEKARQADATAKIKGVQCLDLSVGEFKLFFKGEATVAQVDSSAQCLQNILLAFKDGLRGSAKHVFTTDEIILIIKRDLLKNQNFTTDPQLIKELMIFKVALFGGTDELITKDEIALASNLVGAIRPELSALAPHMKILLQKWEPALQPADAKQKENHFKAAQVKFHSFTQKFASQLASPDRAYEFDHLFNLVKTTIHLTTTNVKTIERLQEFRPFIEQFKLRLIGAGSALQGRQWNRLALALSEGYMQVLRNEYFLVPLGDSQVDQKNNVYKDFALDLSGLLENLLAEKPSQALSNAEIYELILPLTKIFPTFKVNQGLLHDIATIKVTLLGQRDLGQNGWSRADFATLNQKIPALIPSTLTVLQNFKKINGTSAAELPYEQFQTAEARIAQSLNEIAPLVEAAYDLKDLKPLANHLAESLLEGQFTVPENFDSILNIVASVKLTLTGESSTHITKENVQLLISVLGPAFVHFREYQIFIDPYKLKDLSFVEGSILLWSKVKQTALVELSQKTGHLITTAEISQLVLTLQKEKLLSISLSEANLRQALNAMWSHILNSPDERVTAHRAQNGFNKITLETFSNELEIWLQGQKQITQIFIDSLTKDKISLASEITRRMNRGPPREFIAANELQQFINQAVALNFTEKGYLKILAADSGQYTYRDLFYSNAARAFARLFIRGYADDLERARNFSGVTLYEAQFAFNQFEPIAVELELVDANSSFVTSRFREANLFLSESNGDNLANFSELHQLALHIYSGINRAKDLKTKLVRACLPRAPEKISSHTSISEDCALDVYLAETESFEGLPQFLKMRDIQPLPEATQMRAHYLSLLKTVGHVPNEQKTIQFQDADLFPHVIQYIEMIYARYDLNRDNLLQKEEALKAFPAFKSTLKDAVKAYDKIKEDDLPGVFIYILKNGAPPKKTSLSELLKFLGFIHQADQKDWIIESTRLDLGKIFNYIAEVTKAPPIVKPIPQPLLIL